MVASQYCLVYLLYMSRIKVCCVKPEIRCCIRVESTHTEVLGVFDTNCSSSGTHSTGGTVDICALLKQIGIAIYAILHARSWYILILLQAWYKIHKSTFQTLHSTAVVILFLPRIPTTAYHFGGIFQTIPLQTFWPLKGFTDLAGQPLCRWPHFEISILSNLLFLQEYITVFAQLWIAISHPFLETPMIQFSNVFLRFGCVTS